MKMCRGDNGLYRRNVTIMHQESHSLGYLAPLVITYKTIIIIVPQKYCQFTPTYDLSGNTIKKKYQQ